MRALLRDWVRGPVFDTLTIAAGVGSVLGGFLLGLYLAPSMGACLP